MRANVCLNHAIVLLALVALVAQATGAEPNMAENATLTKTSETAKDAAAAKAAQKTPWTAQIVRRPVSEGGITGLTFDVTTIPVTLVPREDRLRPLVLVRARYRRAGGWQIFAGEEPLNGKGGDPTEVKIYAYLTARSNVISLTAKNPQGETEREDIVVLAPDAQEFRINSPWGELILMIGAAKFNYYQTGFGNFDSYTGIASAYYSTPDWDSRFGLHGAFRSTLVTFSSEPPDLEPQLMNGRIDATMIVNRNPFSSVRFTLAGGAGFITMLTNGSPFGFSNLLAPEYGGQLAYAFGASGSTLVGRVRLIPLVAFLDFDLIYTHRLGNLHRVEICFGALAFSYFPDAETQVKTSLISLRFGYSL